VAAIGIGIVEPIDRDVLPMMIIVTDLVKTAEEK